MSTNNIVRVVNENVSNNGRMIDPRKEIVKITSTESPINGKSYNCFSANRKHTMNTIKTIDRTI